MKETHTANNEGSKMSKIEITVKRANGNVEKVEWTQSTTISDELWSRMKAANAKTGTEMISWEKIEEPKSDLPKHHGWCDKCGTYCYGDCDA